MFVPYLLAASALATYVDAESIKSFLRSRSELSNFYETLERVPDWLTELDQFRRNITILAPVNDAFSPYTLPDTFGTSEGILAGDDKEALTDLMKYHVLNGSFSLDDLAMGGSRWYRTLHYNGLVWDGQRVAITADAAFGLQIESGTSGFTFSESTVCSSAPTRYLNFELTACRRTFTMTET
jgi:uncharacterized surface protein with fasciclin (FAS1) repeats